jgi:hypothetical protein
MITKRKNKLKLGVYISSKKVRIAFAKMQRRAVDEEEKRRDRWVASKD